MTHGTKELRLVLECHEILRMWPRVLWSNPSESMRVLPTAGQQSPRTADVREGMSPRTIRSGISRGDHDVSSSGGCGHLFGTQAV